MRFLLVVAFSVLVDAFDVAKKHHHHHHHHKHMRKGKRSHQSTIQQISEPKKEIEGTNPGKVAEAKAAVVYKDPREEESKAQVVYEDAKILESNVEKTKGATALKAEDDKSTAPETVELKAPEPTTATTTKAPETTTEAAETTAEAPKSPEPKTEDAKPAEPATEDAKEVEPEVEETKAKEEKPKTEDVKPKAKKTKKSSGVALPYGQLEPFGRRDTAADLTEDSIKESNEMVDQIEKAEVAEEKRAVFRALTRLRGVAVTSFDGVARSQTGNIEDYTRDNKWRDSHPMHHLADEESDVSKWAFPEQAD